MVARNKVGDWTVPLPAKKFQLKNSGSLESVLHELSNLGPEAVRKSAPIYQACPWLPAAFPSLTSCSTVAGVAKALQDAGQRPREGWVRGQPRRVFALLHAQHVLWDQVLGDTDLRPHVGPWPLLPQGDSGSPGSVLCHPGVQGLWGCSHVLWVSVEPDLPRGWEPESREPGAGLHG